MVTFDNL